MTDIDAIPTHLTRVAGVARVSSSFVRVTFRGGLDRYVSAGPDDFVYVLLPPPGRNELTIDTSFRWTQFYEMDEADRPVGAYYTVRAIRAGDECELDCDVYLHEPAGSVSRWAPIAAVGDPVALWGPRTAWAPPASTTSWLLAADETGLPGLCRILDGRPQGVPVHAFIEVATPFDEIPLPVANGDDDVSVTWLHRDGAEGGTTTLLADAIRASWPATVDGVYAWGGAESRAMTAVRKHLRREIGLAREQVSMTAYWRHADHAGDPIEDDD